MNALPPKTPFYSMTKDNAHAHRQNMANNFDDFLLIDDKHRALTTPSSFKACANASLALLNEYPNELRLDRTDSDWVINATTGGAERTFRYSASDWPSHEQYCTSSIINGEVLRYHTLKISCQVRNTQRGAVADTITFVNVPDCFPIEKSACNNGVFSEDSCNTYAQWAAGSWEEEYRNAGFSYANCQPSFDGCYNSYDQDDGSANVGVIVGATLGGLAACVACGGALLYAFRRKSKKDNNQKDNEPTSHQDSSDSNDNQDNDVDVDDSSSSNSSDEEAPNPTDMEKNRNETPGEDDSSNNRENKEGPVALLAAAPKWGMGILRGWIRDRHFKHTCLWLGVVIWTIVWIVFASTECEPSRYSDGCDIDDPSYFWHELTWLVVFIWFFLYIPFVLEFYWSSTHKYLKNINTTESLVDYMNRLYTTKPALSLTMECYHLETRIVHYTDANGNSATRTETYPVVTYTETEQVNIVSWTDTSQKVNMDDISEYRITKVTITKSFDGDSSFLAQKNSLIVRNRHRDVSYHLNVNYSIDGYKDKLLSFVDLESRPFFLNLAWCWIVHITFWLALPYRVWFSSITGKIETNVHKKLVTTWGESSSPTTTTQVIDNGYNMEETANENNPDENAVGEPEYDVDKEQENQITVLAPKGPLGLSMNDTSRGPNQGHVVAEVKDTSPLKGQVSVGDEIIAIDNVDLTKMVSLDEMIKAIRESSGKARALTIVPKGKNGNEDGEFDV